MVGVGDERRRVRRGERAGLPRGDHLPAGAVAHRHLRPLLLPTVRPLQARHLELVRSTSCSSQSLLPDPNFCCSCIFIHPLLLYNCARYLSVEKSRSIFVRLFPEPGRVAKEQPPLARFLLRVSWAGPPRRTCVSPGSGYLLLSIPDS